MAGGQKKLMSLDAAERLRDFPSAAVIERPTNQVYDFSIAYRTLLESPAIKSFAFRKIELTI